MKNQKVRVEKSETEGGIVNPYAMQEETELLIKYGNTSSFYFDKFAIKRR